MQESHTHTQHMRCSWQRFLWLEHFCCWHQVAWSLQTGTVGMQLLSFARPPDMHDCRLTRLLPSCRTHSGEPHTCSATAHVHLGKLLLAPGVRRNVCDGSLGLLAYEVQGCSEVGTHGSNCAPECAARPPRRPARHLPQRSSPTRLTPAAQRRTKTARWPPAARRPSRRPAASRR